MMDEPPRDTGFWIAWALALVFATFLFMLNERVNELSSRVELFHGEMQSR